MKTHLPLSVIYLFLFATAVSAQSAPSNGWLDVNVISATSQQDAQSYTFTAPLFLETSAATASYPAMPTAKGAEVGGGAQFHKQLGFGVHLLRANYDYTVGLGISIPHPLIFNRQANASGTSNVLSRKDTDIDLSVNYILHTADAVRVRVFGGPTYFKVEQAMVGPAIHYNQLFSLAGVNTVTITTADNTTVSGSAWGFNAGVDVGYFFSRHVGVGGLVRFNKATIAIDSEPLTNKSIDLKAGHTTVGGGLRLRF